jgi:3-dehydroquinate dehydratase-1
VVQIKLAAIFRSALTRKEIYMHTGKPITIHGKPLGSGRFPTICTPLVGRTHEQVLAELALVLPKQPDLLEWRVDFFTSIDNTTAVLSTATAIRAAAAGIPVLFTRRSTQEGGEPIPLNEEQVVDLMAAVCASGTVALVDYEMNNDPAHIAQVRTAAHAHGVQLLLSFHNFQSTPTQEALSERFAQAQALGADVAKIAVMPQRLEDVLAVLAATLESSQKLNIPVASMSMGGYGALTRLVGGIFGSAMSFAVGAAASAPGQVPIEDMNTVLAILQKSLPPKP